MQDSTPSLVDVLGEAVQQAQARIRELEDAERRLIADLEDCETRNRSLKHELKLAELALSEALEDEDEFVITISIGPGGARVTGWDRPA